MVSNTDILVTGSLPRKQTTVFIFWVKRRSNMKEGSGIQDGMTGSLKLPMKSVDMKKEMENFI